MIIHNIGYNHCHDSDFFIDRPNGSHDNLLLLLRTSGIFTIQGKDTIAPKHSFFFYPTGAPQIYRCLPQHSFENDWIHFLFEPEEERLFASLQIPTQTSIPIDNLQFLSFCVKSLAYESCSQNLHRSENMKHYFFLLLNKVSEQVHQAQTDILGAHYEMLSTIRNKIYAKPYEPRTIDSTAHEVRMSKSAFQHLYKEQFGVSFFQDLIDSRIAYAQMLLTSTNMTVSEIAVQCGYRHYAHFARQFKEKCGITPMEYRMQQQ